MYGNSYHPFIMPNNMPYQYGIGTRSLFNTGGIRNIVGNIHNINWNGMLNSVSRTLGVVREAIPVVKEVRPMINNMRSMIKIASVFKDETDTPKKENNIKKESSTTNSTTANYNYHNEPNFFL